MKLLINSIILVMLVGCSSAPLVVTETPEIPVYHPSIDPIRTRPVEFIVITDSTKDKLNTNKVWYAISVNDYENLAYNTQEMLRYIKDQKAALTYYRNLENKN